MKEGNLYRVKDGINWIIFSHYYDVLTINSTDFTYINPKDHILCLGPPRSITDLKDIKTIKCLYKNKVGAIWFKLDELEKIL